MKKILLFLFFVSIVTINVNSQTTIGSLEPPVQGAVLDLQSDTLGFVPTRVKLENLTSNEPIGQHVKGMVVYNLTTDIAKSLLEGLYLNNGSGWIRLFASNNQREAWFYMPSIVFDVSKTTEEGKFEEVNLWDEYERQKNKHNENGNPYLVKNPSAPDQVMANVPGRNDFNYYVTNYDDKVFEIISISDDGLMRYRVIGKATDATHINIVFVEK